MDVGPNRDLIMTKVRFKLKDDLSIAVRETGLKFGLYHSLFEWFNFLFISDRNSGFKQQYFPKTKTLPELYDIVNTYKPEVIWSDGDGGGDDEYWNSRYFLQWLYNESPVKETVVTNDRWGSNTLCKHGGYWTCTDRFIPGKLLPRKWENAMTLDKNSWGYNRLSHINDYLTIDELLKTMAQTVSFGGNLLVNVGPTSDGRIVPIMEERLLQMGEWLGLNGEAIYKSKPWKYQNDTQTANVWYTSDKTSSTVYAIFFNWPENKVLSLASIAATNTTTISLITKNGDLRLKWIKSSQTTDITLPIIPPCNWAYTLKIEDY
ncbi:alpha-L-fucosidase-like protein [Leptotrombidium deliense]|uniref:alpha-L-fucosidase n=1 Tax=Leptotrombidium deliense TaxID=299467 RepID=A0A443SSH9_9ACAR|nr:alpha-L-fucosidase-like protein [Leptotrombidium deliense]